MKYCPDCNEEYDDSVSRCPNCEVPLIFSVDEERDQISDFDEDGEELPSYQDLVVVYTGELYSAELIKGDLIANNIDAWIANEEVTYAVGTFITAAGGPVNVEVVVAPANEQRALDLIEGAGGLTDTPLIEAEREARENLTDTEKTEVAKYDEESDADADDADDE